jgi:hypothetical protein
VSGFRYLPAMPDGQPPDPVAFVTAIPNWRVDETLMVGSGKQFRIVAKSEDLDALDVRAFPGPGRRSRA